MKKLCYMLFWMMLSVSILVGCQSNNSFQSKMSNTLGIDVSKGTEIAHNDSHGGFHGDGMTFVSISFSDNAILSQILENNEWKPMPLTQNLSILAYGITTDDSRIGPYLTGENREAVMPEIENGYYYFIDRHSQSTNSHDDSEVLNRYSLNFTIAIYDVDTNILYYAKLDT